MTYGPEPRVIVGIVLFCRPGKKLIKPKTQKKGNPKTDSITAERRVLKTEIHT